MRFLFITSFIAAFLLMVPAQSRAEVPERWEKQCNIDKITDKRSCSAYILSHYYTGKYDSNSVLLVIDNNGFYLSGDIDASHPVMLRVDKNKPYSTRHYESQTIDNRAAVFSNAKNIISEMRKGNHVVVQFIEWPSGWKIEQEVSLEGFNEAYTQYLQDK